MAPHGDGARRAEAEVVRRDLLARCLRRDQLWPPEEALARPLVPLTKTHPAALGGFRFLGNFALNMGKRRFSREMWRASITLLDLCGRRVTWDDNRGDSAAPDGEESR